VRPIFPVATKIGTRPLPSPEVGGVVVGGVVVGGVTTGGVTIGGVVVGGGVITGGVVVGGFVIGGMTRGEEPPPVPEESPVAVFAELDEPNVCD
jgi:hypothetical protein